MNSWALMVVLPGEGQEIHLGEESGLAQWNDFVIGDEESLDVFDSPACKLINAPRSDFFSGCGNRFTDKAVTEMSVVQNTVISNEEDFRAYIDRRVDERIAKSRAGSSS